MMTFHRLFKSCAFFYHICTQHLQLTEILSQLRFGSYRASVSGTPSSRVSVSGTPSKSEDSIDVDGFSVMVAVRVRPVSQKEEKDPDVKRVVSMDGN